VATTRLTRSREDYLKALFALDDGARAVPVRELAQRLAVSPPSVTNMLSRLASEGLVEHVRRVGGRLTALGRKRALETVRRHRLLETFLVGALALDWAEAHEDAEVLEHAVSDRVLDAIERLMGHPTEDPHGHPIPDRHGRVPRRALVPLASLEAGARATVREIRDRDRRRMERWQRNGLTPGARVRVVDADRAGGVHTLEVRGRRLVTGAEALDGVLVECRRREGRS
jgi:DtxR family Mn-dependent transcriptional regulator